MFMQLNCSNSMMYVILYLFCIIFLIIFDSKDQQTCQYKNISATESNAMDRSGEVDICLDFDEL